MPAPPLGVASEHGHADPVGQGAADSGDRRVRDLVHRGDRHSRDRCRREGCSSGALCGLRVRSDAGYEPGFETARARPASLTRNVFRPSRSGAWPPTATCSMTGLPRSATRLTAPGKPPNGASTTSICCPVCPSVAPARFNGECRRGPSQRLCWRGPLFGSVPPTGFEPALPP